MPTAVTIAPTLQVTRQSSSAAGARVPMPTVTDGSAYGAALFVLFLCWLLAEWLGLTMRVPALRAARPTTIALGILCLIALIRAKAPTAIATRQGLLLLGLLVMTTLSVFWAEVQTRAFNEVTGHLGYYAGFIVTAVAVTDRRRCDRLAMTLSFIVLALVGSNVGKLISETRSVGYVGGYFLGDANDFAWGLNTLVPFALYLAISKRSVAARLFGVVAFVAGAIGIVGTQSRGGSLALAAALLYFWIAVAKRKTLGLVAIVAVAVIALTVAPSTYVERLGTIATYEEDNSAVSRLQVWRAGYAMALDYPLGVGAGNFPSAYGRHYLPSGDDNAINWGAGRWLNAHSVYFKVMGEYGFLGFAMLLGILAANFRSNLAMGRRLRSGELGDVLPPEWPSALNMSLVGFATGGAFLGGFSYPHLYFLSALPLATAGILSSRVPSAASARPAPLQYEPVSDVSGLQRVGVAGVNPAYRTRRASR